jgi:MFS family permease
VPRRLVRRARRAAGRFPGQFWLVFAATFVYLASSALVFPYFGIYLTERMGVSRTEAGLVLGLASLAGLPLQILGGSWADRRGRRGLLLFSLLATALVSFFLAAARTAWQAEALVLVNGALGWPLFLTASNAMVADLVEQQRTAEAFGMVRVALNAGVVAGPAVAGFALAGGLSFSWLFLAAGTGCAGLLVLLLARLAETRPVVAVQGAAARRVDAGPLDAAEALAAAEHAAARSDRGPSPSGDAPGPGPRRPARRGYGLILRDRRFLVFCAVSLLPLFCYGQVVTTYPVYLTQFLGVPLSRWGLLLSLNGVLIVAIQYPLVRRLPERSHLRAVALASVLLGVGVGGAAFAADGWSLWLLMAVFSFGEMLFVPLSTSLVSGMTTVAERGRYMGAWSLVWIGGQALSPLVTGWSMDTFGGRPAFAAVLAVGLAGAALLTLSHGVLRPVPAVRDAC